MRTTKYFDYMRKRPDRAMTRDEWMAHVIGHPEKTEVQSMVGYGSGRGFPKPASSSG